MSTVQTNAIAIQRQGSLVEAFLFALATHAAILVILSLLGLLSLLTERTAERNPDRDLEVQFTVAPESPAEAPSEPTDAAAPSDLPPLPAGAPAEYQIVLRSSPSPWAATPARALISLTITRAISSWPSSTYASASSSSRSAYL